MNRVSPVVVFVLSACCLAYGGFWIHCSLDTLAWGMLEVEEAYDVLIDSGTQFFQVPLIESRDLSLVIMCAAIVAFFYFCLSNRSIYSVSEARSKVRTPKSRGLFSSAVLLGLFSEYSYVVFNDRSFSFIEMDSDQVKVELMSIQQSVHLHTAILFYLALSLVVFSMFLLLGLYQSFASKLHEDWLLLRMDKNLSPEVVPLLLNTKTTSIEEFVDKKAGDSGIVILRDHEDSGPFCIVEVEGEFVRIVHNEYGSYRIVSVTEIQAG